MACLSAVLAACLLSAPAAEAGGRASTPLDGRALYRDTVAGRPGCPVRPGPGFPLDPVSDARQRVRTRAGALFAESSTELGYGIVWGLGRDGRQLSVRERAAVARHGARNFTLSDSCAELTSFYRVVLGAYNREVLRMIRTRHRARR